jgi:hypothetical protein
MTGRLYSAVEGGYATDPKKVGETIKPELDAALWELTSKTVKARLIY